MPLRRTKRSDGRQRPRWKDGSHVYVESTNANESRCKEVALQPNRQAEPLVTVPPLLERNHENKVSTRDRLARTGADARIEESVVIGEVCLALQPYGRSKKQRSGAASEYGDRQAGRRQREEPRPRSPASCAARRAFANMRAHASGSPIWLGSGRSAWCIYCARASDLEWIAFASGVA
jgi:hypothetical protein